MNLLLTHMKKEKAPRQLPRGFWLLFSVHATLQNRNFLKQNAYNAKRRFS